jgi:hypothetical protein
MNKQSATPKASLLDGRRKSYWNEVERICDRCQKSILNDYNFRRYLKIENFFKENHMIFCRCNNHFIISDLIRENDEEWYRNYKLKH